MIYGILSNQSCHLSKIARALDEKTSLKKVIDRLSRNLSSFTQREYLMNNYIKTIMPIKLTARQNDELNLVVCYGFGKTPILLITNLKSEDKRLGVSIVKVYLTRWRIEEYYRYKKQPFKFEDLRVRSMNSIINLDLLLTIALGYIGFMSEKFE